MCRAAHEGFGADHSRRRVGSTWGLRPKPRAADVASAIDWTAAAPRSGDGGGPPGELFCSGVALGHCPSCPPRTGTWNVKAWLEMEVFTGTEGITAESCPNLEGCADAGGERPANAETGSVVKMEKQILSPALDKLRKHGAVRR